MNMSEMSGTRIGSPLLKPQHLRLHATLKDGTRVLVRALRPGDRAELRRGFGLLSLASRRFRFITPIRRLSEPQLEQLTAVDQIDHVAIGARDVGRRGRPGVAVARFVRLQAPREAGAGQAHAGESGGAGPDGTGAGQAAADPRTVAEFAVTVIDAYQGRGLGTLLVRLLLQAARSVGVEVLRGYVLEDNTAMLRILGRFVTETHRDSGNVLRIDMPVDRNLQAIAASEADPPT